MFFETELSDKLNNELESAGICVSETLIAKTLAAVQAARTAEEREVPDTEWTEASEENIKKLIELTGVRKKRRKGIAPVLFRAATVMAACLVLVVGGFALRFSTMRAGKETAPMAPMMTDENRSARNSISYTTDADSVMVGDDYELFGETFQAQVEESAVAAEEPMEAMLEPIEPTVECDVAEDAVTEDEVQAEWKEELSDVQNAAALTERLLQAETVNLRRNAQGVSVYEFFVSDNTGEQGYYWVYEDGMVEFAKVLQDGQAGMVESPVGSENIEFRRAVLVWMKEYGYLF